MAVALIAIRSRHLAKGARVAWLLEDMWLYRSGDAELQLECIIESTESLQEALILIAHHVETVKDLSHLYQDASFQDGYPSCWPDIYLRLEIDASGRTANVNDVAASMGRVDVSLGYTAPTHSEVVAKFDPPIRAEARLFRLGLLCRSVTLPTRFDFPWREKRLRTCSYGMGPFSGSPLDSLLTERKIVRDAWLPVDRHIIYAKILAKEPVVTSCAPSPWKCYAFGPCEFPARVCPPLEQMASQLGTSVSELKKEPSQCVAWEFDNVLPVAGQPIDFAYFLSGLQKWLSQNWLALTAILIAALSLLITLLVS